MRRNKKRWLPVSLTKEKIVMIKVFADDIRSFKTSFYKMKVVHVIVESKVGKILACKRLLSLMFQAPEKDGAYLFHKIA